MVLDSLKLELSNDLFSLVVSGWNEMGISKKPVVLALGRSTADL